MYDSGANSTKRAVKSLENRYVYKHPVMHFRDDGKQQYSLGKTHMSRNCKMTIPNPYKNLVFIVHFEAPCVKRTPKSLKNAFLY